MNVNDSTTLPTGNAEQAQGELKTEVATIRITRKQLYERIWAESVAHVAPTLGLWPRRLSTICAKNRIPMPGRGYWYWARSDRKTMRDPLPNAEQDWEITFAPSQPGPPKPAVDVSALPRVVVPERLGRSHRLVQAAKATFNDAWTNNGIYRLPRGCLDIRVSESSFRRACRIMNTVIKECERRGWPVSATTTEWFCTVINVGGCDVGVQLAEGLLQEPRQLSESEKIQESQRERPRKRPLYILAPNGRLTLRIQCSEARLYGHWRDGKRRRLEDMLDAFMAYIEKAPEEKIKADKARAEAEKLAAEAEERRRVAEQLRLEEEERQAELRRARQRVLQAEQARVDELLADAESWEESRRLRAYIKERLSQARRAGKPIGRNSEFGKWLIWARAQADRLDPLVKSPPSILDTKPTPSPPAEERNSFADYLNSLGQR